MYATVTEVKTSGVRLRLDGEQEASTKEYAVLRSYHPKVGDRVRVEESGNTMIVSGAVGAPSAIEQLSTGATSAQIVSKINEIINAM